MADKTKLHRTMRFGKEERGRGYRAVARMRGCGVEQARSDVVGVGVLDDPAERTDCTAVPGRIRTISNPVIANQCAHWCGNPFSLPPGASFLSDQKGCKESPKGEDFVFSPLWKPLIETTQGAPAPWIPCKGNCFRFSAVGIGVLDDPAEYARFLPISGESAPRFNLIIPCFNLIILA